MRWGISSLMPKKLDFIWFKELLYVFIENNLTSPSHFFLRVFNREGWLQRCREAIFLRTDSSKIFRREFRNHNPTPKIPAKITIRQSIAEITPRNHQAPWWWSSVGLYLQNFLPKLRVTRIVVLRNEHNDNRNVPYAHHANTRDAWPCRCSAVFFYLLCT